MFSKSLLQRWELLTRRWRAVSGSYCNYSRSLICGLGNSNSPHLQIFTDLISLVAVIRFNQSQGNMRPFNIHIISWLLRKNVSVLLLLRLLLLIWEYFLTFYQEFYTDCISSKVCKTAGTHPDHFSKLQRLCSLQFLCNCLKCKNTPTFFPSSHYLFTQKLNLPNFSQQTLSQTILIQ